MLTDPIVSLAVPSPSANDFEALLNYEYLQNEAFKVAPEAKG